MNKVAVVFTLLSIAAAAAIGFAANVAFGAYTQIGGATLGIAFLALAAALVVWEHELMPHADQSQAMPAQRSDAPSRTRAREAFSTGAAAIASRRSWLVRTLGVVCGVMGLALLAPLRSLIPKDAPPLSRTSWTKGARLVRDDGTPVRASDLEIDSVITVFPQGHVGPNDSADMANAATMLVRVPPDELALPDGRAAWAPDGLIAYSKVCTHAGCPVALYRARERQLFCPCHQSTFDVLRGGRRVFGPAARALPQLPIEIADDGTLRAMGDFPEPVGPDYWERA